MIIITFTWSLVILARDSGDSSPSYDILNLADVFVANSIPQSDAPKVPHFHCS